MRAILLKRLCVSLVTVSACILPAADACSALAFPGNLLDEQTTLVYIASDYHSHPAGTLLVNAPASRTLTSIDIDSASGMFLPEPPAAPQNLDGHIDVYSTDNIRKATFGSSFGDISLGLVLPAGLPPGVVLEDLTAVGSLAGGGGLGDVDLVYVDVDTSIPEPSTAAVFLGLLGIAFAAWRRH